MTVYVIWSWWPLKLQFKLKWDSLKASTFQCFHSCFNSQYLTQSCCPTCVSPPPPCLHWQHSDVGSFSTTCVKLYHIKRYRQLFCKIVQINKKLTGELYFPKINVNVSSAVKLDCFIIVKDFFVGQLTTIKSQLQFEWSQKATCNNCNYLGAVMALPKTCLIL